MDKQIHTAIFYADDDVDDLDFFKEVASELDQYVSLFDEGSKLLKGLNNPPPKASLVFLDLNMPVKSGFDILKAIKATPSLKHIPVIIFTTSTNPKDVEVTKNLGASLYIQKPSSVGALRKAIDYVLSIDWKNFSPSDKQFVYQH